jgi:predicted unusual protein kinase regulating ubiquinone biosynthesis (AarF/ABC1/UbiB family)
MRHPRRLWQVIVVIALFAIAPALHLGRYAGLGRPARFRLGLQRLGGAWVKLGQMLAMRYDLLPIAYCDELFKLLNEVEPFPYEHVRGIIREELGDDPERLFRSFSPTSFAAASIGQVHRATLWSGETVAVKVQRPGIRQALQADIDLMQAVAGFLDRTRLLGATRSREVIDEFARWTADELDYLVEARQAVVLYENARGDPNERIARVYPDLSTARVLTTEHLDGIPIIDIMVAARNRDTEYLEALAEHGHDIDRMLLHLDWNMLNQVYVHGYFHADLHPANLYLLPGDAIGYVDFGIVARLPDEVRTSLTRYSWSLFRGDVENAVRELMRWVAPTPTTDVTTARAQLVRTHQTFLYETGRRPGDATPGAGRDRQPVDNPYLQLAVGIMQTVRSNDLNVSRSVVAYLRMLVTLGTLRHELARDYDVARHVRRFFRKLMRQNELSWLDPRQGLERLYVVSGRVRRAIEFMEFLEAQEPLIAAAGSSFLGVQRRIATARRRLVMLGVSVLAVGGALYVVLADPRGTTALLPAGMPYAWVQVGLLVVLVVLIVSLVQHVRGFGRPS